MDATPRRPVSRGPRRFARARVLAVLFALGAGAAAAADYVEGEILVLFHDSVSAERLAEIEQEFGLTLIREMKLTPSRHYALPPGADVLESASLISALTEVKAAEPNGILRLNAVPSDPLFPEQWSLHNTGQRVLDVVGSVDADVDLPEALDLYSGAQEVVVAYIDSGVGIDHPDFDGYSWSNSGDNTPDGIDNDGNGYIDDEYGWDFVDDDRLPLDENGHGTQGASLVAARQNDGVGIAGIAPHAKIMALRVATDAGSIVTTNVIGALEYAEDKAADIVNLSLGGLAYNASYEATLGVLDTSGILVVIAAGNGDTDRIGDNNDVTPTYPASYAFDNIIAVAATDQLDQLASFSNFGPTSVDIAAPGTNILTADVSRSVFTSEPFDSGNGA